MPNTTIHHSYRPVIALPMDSFRCLSDAVLRMSQMQNARRREKTIVILSILVSIAAFVIALFNRQNVPLALQNAIVFAGFVCLLMVFLHIGALIAERKGYPTWFGVVMTLMLNIVGLIILLVLPSKLNNADSV